VLEFHTNKNSQLNLNSRNQSLDNISENYKENSPNITNLESEQQSESKKEIQIMSHLKNEMKADTYQLDFDQLSQRWITRENSKIKDLIDTNNFSCIKSSLGQENIKNFLEESKLDSFIRQITSIPTESNHLRNKL
jgi:hypothetical protein